MPDQIRVPVKIAVAGAGNATEQTALAAFNTAMAAAVTTAMGTLSNPGPANFPAGSSSVGNVPTGITFDPVGCIYTGSVYVFFGALNYITFANPSA
jgi:hypothetical protein